MAPRQDSTSVSIRPATFARKMLLAGMLALPALAFASEEYSLTVTMPIVRPGEPVSLEKVTFRTWYSITETQVSAVTWDPCESEGQPADCNLVNPVHAAGIKAWLYAYNVQHGEPPEGCYIQVDLSRYQSLDPALQHAIGTADVKGELIRLLVRGIEAGTRTSDHHLDCELRLIPPGSADGLDPATLPRYVNPVIPPCQETTPAQQTQARAHNAEGMQRYLAGDWHRLKTHSAAPPRQTATSSWRAPISPRCSRCRSDSPKRRRCFGERTSWTRVERSRNSSPTRTTVSYAAITASSTDRNHRWAATTTTIAPALRTRQTSIPGSPR